MSDTTIGVPTLCRRHANAAHDGPHCGATIVFLWTKNGKKMPVDVASWKAGETQYVYGQHVSHYATCPYAKFYRQPKPRKEVTR